MGIIKPKSEENPIIFHFISIGHTIIFQVSDVMKIEYPSKELQQFPHKVIIRLKGPIDYDEIYENEIYEKI